MVVDLAMKQEKSKEDIEGESQRQHEKQEGKAGQGCRPSAKCGGHEQLSAAGREGEWCLEVGEAIPAEVMEELINEGWCEGYLGIARRAF